GQELLSFAGRVITSANDFQNVLGIYPEGSRVALSWRDVDQVRTATIRLRPLHAFQKAPELPAERKPPRPPNPEDDSDPAPEMPMPEVSPELLKLFEEREGYANFRYNALRQNELLLPLKEAMKATPDVSGTWVLKVKGEIKNTVADSADSSVVVKPVSGEIVIGDTASSLTLGSDQWYQSADDVQAQNEPPEFRGLLAALLHLKSFLTRQGVGFDDVSATAHIGSGGLSSLTPGLIIRDGGKTGRWHFDRKSPFPSALDYEYAQGSDEARITFDSWNLKNGIPLPDRIGWTSPETEVVVWLQVENVSRTVAEEKTEADPQPVVPPAQGASEKQTFIDHQRGQQPAGILRTLFEIRNQLRPERMLMSQIVTEPQETSAAAGSDVSSMIQARQSVVVKLFGAGVGNLDSYGSGVLISAEGHVLTVWNHLINVGFLTAVTSDGRRFSVEVVGTNREHDVAVLKLRADDDRPFPWLDLTSAGSAHPGEPVTAVSNNFHG
ncbi:MAG: trypsin-like peptidase domain-containing protein, partial [Planctomyces sp.]